MPGPVERQPDSFVDVRAAQKGRLRRDSQQMGTAPASGFLRGWLVVEYRMSLDQLSRRPRLMKIPADVRYLGHPRALIGMRVRFDKVTDILLIGGCASLMCCLDQQWGEPAFVSQGS